ncbi:LysR family transcriptional regulator [Microbacterium marinilacus]|uniref:LysR family transcriptional regulator n=1 Tax=Microbacterium marinilacus TaxID=415209 RepID=A0ABP7BQN5_9MICO|nr:LysR family transcriptional regulator [Microbacterium marinilacus]MBY0690404.1 LysR family transcriptional regulator [Microbacterium marinilacus]
MDLSLREMRAILAASEHGSLSAAAAELRTAQSNLSRIVAAAEARLGHRVFVRSSRSLTLTAEGELLREAAQRVVALYDAEMRQLDSRLAGAVGRVRLAMLPSVSSMLVPRLLRLMADRHPAVEVSFVDGGSDEVHEMVAGRRADIGIASEVSHTEGVRHVRYLSDAFVALVPRSHPLAPRAEVSWADLADETFVSLPGGTSVHTLTSAALLQAGVSPRSELRAPNMLLAAGLVAEGLGVIAVPSLTLGLFDARGLARIPLGGPRVSRELALLHHGEEELSAAVRAGLGSLHLLRREEGLLPEGASWSGPPSD